MLQLKRTVVLQLIAGCAIACHFGRLSLAAEAPKPARCHVTVKVLRKSGETQERTFDLALDSEARCKKAARQHETNFNPHVIEKIEVSYAWEKAK